MNSPFPADWTQLRENMVQGQDILVTRASVSFDHAVGETECSGSSNHWMSVNYGHTGNFCTHICSCSETNPEGGKRSIECILCWKIGLRRGVDIGFHIAEVTVKITESRPECPYSKHHCKLVKRFSCAFGVDRQGFIAVFLLFFLLLFDKMEKNKLRCSC